MPNLNFTQSVAAGGTYQPLTGWAYEFLPWPARVVVLLNASAVGCFAAVQSGTEELLADCPITAGGTAGVMPTEQGGSAPAVSPVVFNAAAGDKLRIAARNPTGGAVTINGTVVVNPIG